jgi:hypothetical protein
VSSIFHHPPRTRLGSVIFALQVLLVALIPLMDDGGRLTPLPYDVATLAVATLTTWLLGYRRTATAMAVWSIGVLAWTALVSRDMPFVRLPLWLSMFCAGLVPAVLCIKSAFALSVPPAQRIFCGAASFVQLGFMFATVHGLVGIGLDGSYAVTPGVEGGRPLRWVDFVWLSFATLTTAGFADVAPVTAAAYAVSTLEGLCGILFPATLIARIASVPPVPAGHAGPSSEGSPSRGAAAASR